MLAWLRPGLHIKRWLFLMTLGVAFLGLGIGYFLREIYESYSFPNEVYYLTLQFLPRPVRGGIFLLAALGMVGVGIAGFSKTLVSAYRPANDSRPMAHVIFGQRQRNRGPRIVAIGGGTGLSMLLRGLKAETDNLTAVVTVADDGGSSGRLRRDMGVLPPGDFRNCIAALADAEPLVTRLMQYRFEEGELKGHSFGNLFIVAMSGVVGNFEAALQETSRVLAVRGQIVPSTLEDVTLEATFVDAPSVRGESKIPESGLPISRLSIIPADPDAHPAAVQAILDADMIVMGPGSLYTSILPNLLVPGIAAAIRASSATKVYVCNVATQPGETDDYSAEDHVEAINRHVGAGLFRHMLMHDAVSRPVPSDGRAQPVGVAGRTMPGVKLTYADVVSDQNALRHDSQKLATALIQVWKDSKSSERSAPAA
jgi:uncharacterized cofD-like protein